MGFTGASLTAGLALGVAPSSSRVDAAAVTSFLANGCAVGGAIGAFVNGGNSFGAAAVLQTNDGFPLSIGVSGDGGGGLRITAGKRFDMSSPNVVNGASDNSVTNGTIGNTISGGGAKDGGFSRQNTIFGISSDFNTVSGGDHNHISGSTHSTISGGTTNSATNSNYSTVGGGYVNSVGGAYATISGGSSNVAAGELATIPGGKGNSASGKSSFAAGNAARADRQGAFVWADSNDLSFTTSVLWPIAGGVNSFSVRATGGVTFVTKIHPDGAILAECYLSGSPAVLTSGWTCSSDRNAKERVTTISPKRVLERLITMPVSEWSMIGSTMRQIGPMAQDFYRAFGLGDSDKAINSVNAQGVAFAAIQGLNEKVQAKEKEIARLSARLRAIEQKLGLSH